jgi:hypothetical protein
MIGKLGILIAGGRGDISSACFSHGRADRSENFVVDGDLD